MQDLPWIATCPHDTVDVLARELQSIGIVPKEILYRGILFQSDLESAYRAHLLLRTASRLQRVVSKFENITDLASLEAALKTIRWPEWLRTHRPFDVIPTLADYGMQILDEDTIIQAVVASIQASDFGNTPPKYDPDYENAVTIVPFFRAGVCMLGIDTAGRALHKRGWRTNGHPAVLKETLAASLLMMADYTGEEVLLDPMCGSGTVVIEAAYIALNKAPLIHRGKDDFTLEHLAGFDRPLWRKIGDQLRAQKKPELPAPIYASDMNAKYVDVAKQGSLRARVEKYIKFSVARFQDLEPPASRGLLITNLPYGERIGAGYIDQLYSRVGEVINQRYQSWRIALLVPVESPIHLLGIKPTREFVLRNGALDVKLLVVDRK